jgi:hypothetical protein
VSGKSHAPADVPTRYQLNKGLRGTYSKSRRLGEEKQFLPLARFKTRTVHPAAYGTSILCPNSRIPQTLQQLATSWTARDRIPVRAGVSAPVPTGPGAHPASCKMGTGSFRGVAIGRGVTLTPQPLLVPRSKNRVDLYLYST